MVFIMSYFDKAENVKNYIKMCEGYEASHLINRLHTHLNSGAQLLELGSGPGNDIERLQQRYHVTASDYSKVFVKHLKQRFSALNVVQCDANHLPKQSLYDCIYSNKVLHHLTPNQLVTSLTQQYLQLNKGGVLAHSVWIGAENFELEGETHYYHQKAALETMINRACKDIEWLDYYEYDEFESNDSAFFIIKKLE
jgi:trans-aconitate methyltransferase